MKIKSILNHYFFYNLYQDLIGAKKYLKRYVNDYVKPSERQNILELGCGTGNLCAFLAKCDVNITGIDSSENYINYAQKKYPEQKFICSDITKPLELENTYNIVLAEAIISAISDENVLKMLQNIKKCCNDETRIIFSDMNYSDSAPFFQKFLMKNERNKYCRPKEKYAELISEYFNIKTLSVMKDPYRIPYEKVIIECRVK